MHAIGANDSAFGGSELHVHYHQLLRLVLLGPYEDRTCQMICAPSFDVESAVFISCQGRERRVVARTAMAHLWTAHMHDDRYQPRLPDLVAQRARLLDAALEDSVPIDAWDVEMLEDVWHTLLLGARPAPMSGGLDGTNYHFANRELAATTRNSSPDSVPGRLVRLSENLAAFARSQGAREHRAQLVDGAHALLREHGRKAPWPRLGCENVRFDEEDH